MGKKSHISENEESNRMQFSFSEIRENCGNTVCREGMTAIREFPKMRIHIDDMNDIYMI